MEAAALGPIDDDATLTRRAKAHEPDAWAEIYDRFHPVIYRYAFIRLRNPGEAEDVASQCFMRALTAIDRYDYRGRPILAWLYRITANLVADRIRQQRREPAGIDTGIETAFQLGPEASVGSVDLRRALDGLKREQREVIVLRFFLAFSLRETALALGKSEGAVHSLQVRALENLRARLSV